jgi:hypothetical protein
MTTPMFTLLRMLPMNRLLIEQLPAFAISFIIAEMFYKFHSFMLETGAFLVTWFVIDGVIQLVKKALGVEVAPKP